MPKAKGTAIVDLRAFLERSGGSEAHARLRRALSPEDAALYDEAVAVGWYDLHAYLRMNHALGESLQRADGHGLRDYGRFAAEHDLSTIHRAFLRLANPAYVLEKAGEFWGRFFDVGTWKVTRESTTRAIGELTGFVVDARYCEFLTAYLPRLFELVGAKHVRVAHARCRSHGDPSCVWTLEWR
jgi:hypothetical protein